MSVRPLLFMNRRLEQKLFGVPLHCRSFSPVAVIGKTVLSAQTCLLFLLFTDTYKPVSPKVSHFTDFCFCVQIYLELAGSRSATRKISANTME